MDHWTHSTLFLFHTKNERNNRWMLDILLQTVFYSPFICFNMLHSNRFNYYAIEIVWNFNCCTFVHTYLYLSGCDAMQPCNVHCFFISFFIVRFSASFHLVSAQAERKQNDKKIQKKVKLTSITWCHKRMSYGTYGYCSIGARSA